jgi:hypothetical protein
MHFFNIKVKGRLNTFYPSLNTKLSSFSLHHMGLRIIYIKSRDLKLSVYIKAETSSFVSLRICQVPHLGL